MYLKSSHNGYTLVELVLGIAMFSFILLVITSVTSGLFASYEKGIAIRATQQSARTVGDSIERDSSDAVKISTSAAPPHDVMCIYTQISNGPGFIYYLFNNIIYRQSLASMPAVCANPHVAAARLTANDVTVQDVSVTDYSGVDYRLADYNFTIATTSAFATDLDASHRCSNSTAFCSSTKITGSALARGGQH